MSPRWSRGVARVRRALRRRRTSLAVVVAVGPGQERFLGDCLTSVRAQYRAPREVLVAPWGGSTVSGQAVRTLPAVATGNEARNAGAAAATADAVLFLDATETLRPEALSRLSGELGPGDGSVGTTEGLAGRLWRRGRVPRFDPRHGRFPHAALADPPGVPLDGRVSDGHERTWGTPFGFVPRAAPELDSLTALVADGVAARHVAAVAPAFLDDLEHADDQAVARLAAAIRARPARDLAEIPVETRLRLWLVGAGHRKAMSRLTADRWFDQGQFPTRVADGGVRAVLDVPGVTVPDEVLAVAPTLRVSLQRLVREARGLRATVYAVVPEVDYLAHPPAVTADLVHADSGARLPLTVEQHSDPGVTRWAGRAHQNHDAGALDVTLDPSALPQPGRWRLEISVEVAGLSLTGGVTEREERGSAGILPEGTDWGPDGLLVQHSPRRVPGDAPSRVLGHPSPGLPMVHAVELGEALVVRGTAPGPFTLALCLGDHRVPVSVVHDTDGFTATVPWTWTRWGRETALPSGTWHLQWDSPGHSGDLPVPAAFSEGTPTEELLPRHRVTVRRGLRDQLLVQLGPPLADDELGAWAQARLRAAYTASARPVDPGLVLFSSYAGTGVTDSPRAILDELLVRRPDLRCRWVVADHSVPAPPGTEPVLLRSRAWYDALAGAGLVVTNVEIDRFFRPRPGQRLLQTSHGYPSKAMGLALWRAKNFSPLRQQRQLADTAGTWSVLLTPTPEAAGYYRDQYLYDGPVLDRGYPRDDVLVGPGVPERRAAARAALGLADDDVAVLYAPTWRDEVATNYRSAPLVSHLDVAGLADALGERHVVLLRGHRFHDPPGSGRRVRDVSDHPEINELLLATDVAVLDYSSLRFDLALLGTPMLFLVPDLEEYAGEHRGFLHPFTDTTPGPLVASTDEVIALVRDLPALRAQWADALVAFNQRWNPHQDGHAAARVVTALLDGDG